MTTASPARVQDALDRAGPSALSAALGLIKLGAYLRGQGPQVLRRKAPSLDAGVLATLWSLQLPGDAKASTIQRATSLVGGVTGELAVVAYGTTPTTGQIAVAPNGDIVTLASDAITSLDVNYLPERGAVLVSLALPVATNVLTLPTVYTQAAVAPNPSAGAPGRPGGVILLEDVNAVVGTATGRKVVLVPGSGSPSAGQARLNVAKTTVTFASADAVTSAVVTLLLCAQHDLDTLLAAELDTP